MELRIRQERIRRCWTQSYVAEQVGITKGAIKNIETAQRNPSYTVLVKLENLFCLSHRELFAPATDEPHNLTSNNITTDCGL